MNSPLKHCVRLDDEQRRHLEAIARDGTAAARVATRARVLLHADQARPEGCRSDAWIAAAFGRHVNTVAAIRKSFVAAGAAATLGRRARATPPVPPRIDGRVEAHLVATCCGPPPEGRARWTLELLAGELMRCGLVTSISAEAVRRTLKKTRCSPGGSRPGASRSGTTPGSSPRWRTSLICTPPSTPPRSR